MSSTWLSIGEVARRTGLPPATLRVWEARYGFPKPARGAGGQRCYPGPVVDQVLQVVADRRAGLALPAAIGRARAGFGKPEPSLHASLRRRRPDVPVHRLTKRGLSALSRAIEDEGHNRADQVVVIAGGFQREHRYRQAQARWKDLARGATLALVFADFRAPATPAGGPVEVPLDAAHPLLREWFVIWYGPPYSACLSARELPGQDQGRDADRTFETIWGVEPGFVWEAAEVSCALGGTVFPDLPTGDFLRSVPAGAANQLSVMSALANRMVAYLAAAMPAA